MALEAATWKGADQEFFSRDADVMIVGLYVGVPTLLVSTAVGALIGARTTYVAQ